MSSAEIAVSTILALVLLLMLAPLPHAAQMSIHTWRVELAAGILLLTLLAISQRAGRPFIDLGPGVGRKLAILVLGFALWGAVSAMWSTSVAAAWHHTIVWLEYLLVFALGLSWLREGNGIGRITTTIAIVFLIIGGVCLGDYLTLPDFASLEGVLRARYSAYGELLVTAAPVLWIAAVYRRRTRVWLLLLVPAALGWMTAMMSLSKGVFVAGVAGFAFTFILGLLIGKSTFRRRLVFTGLIWLGLTLGVQWGVSSVSTVPATVDYISGKAEPSRETSLARVFMWKVAARMASDHWARGVGADNFGIRFNDARAAYRQDHPADPADEVNSDFLVERAHNEALQVFAELGVPGVLLLISPFVLFAWYSLSRLRARWRPSLIYCAAVGGMLAFVASSMVSSFSFRIAQNGIVFFLVFSIAVYEVTKRDNRSTLTDPAMPEPGFVTPAVAAILVAAVVTLGLKAGAELYFASADHERDKAVAAGKYLRAAALDPDYAAAYYRLSSRDFQAGEYPAAASELERAIAGGLGVVLTYSSLADCYEKAGDQPHAETTFREALRIFPRSVFLRVRYAIFLDGNGRHSDSDEQMRASRDIDPRQTKGWYSLITRGSLLTFYDARQDPEMETPARLKPQIAVLQYLDKTPGEP